MTTPKFPFTLPLVASSSRHAECRNRTRRRAITGVFLMLALVLFGPNLLQGQTPPSSRMVGLGTLPGGLYPDSWATGVSADGSTVVGYGYDAFADYIDGYRTPFVWTADTGLVDLGTLPGAPFPYSEATGVSADGSTVVGWGLNSQGRAEAFVWTAHAGMVGLGTLPGSPQTATSHANGVSADGATIVGTASNSQGLGEAFVWTADAGMVGLGTLPGNFQRQSVATSVSADGSTVVGYNLEGTNNSEAFVWTAGTGMVGLGTLPGALLPRSFASGVSADGSTVVGASSSGSGFEAFVWTAGTGMVGLGQLPGANLPLSHAYAVSADGSTIVGAARSSSGLIEAIVWTAGTGMVGLGAFPFGFYSSANAVSADGSTIVGVGVNSQGFSEAFILKSTNEIEVALDVKPGSTENPVNLKSQGFIPVAILTTPDFDAGSVDAEMVLLGDPLLTGGDNPTGTKVSAHEFVAADVDGDGDLDMLLFFDTERLNSAGALNGQSTSVEVIGITLDGTLIRGSDSVRIVPRKGKK